MNTIHKEGVVMVSNAKVICYSWLDVWKAAWSERGVAITNTAT